MPAFTQAEPAMSCAALAVGPCEIVLTCRARLQAYGVLKRVCPHARRSRYLRRYPPGL